MGTITSKDTRRITFDNTIKIKPTLTFSKTIQDDIIDDGIETIEGKSSSETNKESLKKFDLLEEEQDYWAKRLEYLKNEHQVINKIIESEYEKTVEETNKLFTSPKIAQEKLQKIKPCLDVRHKILKCYEDNIHQPLVCSSVVQEFTTCVSACSVEE